MPASAHSSHVSNSPIFISNAIESILSKIASYCLSSYKLKFLLLNLIVNLQLFTFLFFLFYYSKQYQFPLLSPFSPNTHQKQYNTNISLPFSTFNSNADENIGIKGQAKRKSSLSNFSYYPVSDDAQDSQAGKNKKDGHLSASSYSYDSSSSVRKHGKEKAGKILHLILTKKGDEHVSPSRETKIVLGKMLGSGGFCEVYEAQYQGKRVALRLAKKKQKDSYVFIKKGYNFNNLFAQHGISPSVYYLFKVKGEPFSGYMMKLMRGDLYASSKLPFSQRIKIADLLIGQVQKLHSLDYFHGDIKPGNILLDDFYNPFISDVDSVAFFGGNTSPTRIAGGTRGYRDPALATHRSMLKERNIRVEYPRSLLEEADTFSTTITIYYLLFKRSIISHMLNSIECNENFQPQSDDSFTSVVADNFGYYLYEYLDKFFLNPERSNDPHADPVVRLLEEGLRSKKDLMTLQENLKNITEQDVTNWSERIVLLMKERLVVECKIEKKRK